MCIYYWEKLFQQASPHQSILVVWKFELLCETYGKNPNLGKKKKSIVHVRITLLRLSEPEFVWFIKKQKKTNTICRGTQGSEDAPLTLLMHVEGDDAYYVIWLLAEGIQLPSCKRLTRFRPRTGGVRMLASRCSKARSLHESRHYVLTPSRRAEARFVRARVKERESSV